MTRLALLAALLCSCAAQQPMLRNVPAPNPAIVAGAAAATAGVLSLLAPTSLPSTGRESAPLPDSAYPMSVTTDADGAPVYSFGEPAAH